MRKTETDRKMTEDTDKMTAENEEAAAKSDTETEEEDRQTITATAAEAVTAAVTATETDTETERAMNSEFRKNIRLLAVIQMILRVLFISQTSLLCFHADQSDVRQSTFLSHDDIHYYTC